jgi:hypothetical protein
VPFAGIAVERHEVEVRAVGEAGIDLADGVAIGGPVVDQPHGQRPAVVLGGQRPQTRRERGGGFVKARDDEVDRRRRPLSARSLPESTSVGEEEL